MNDDPNIREIFGVCEALAEMTEKILSAANIAAGDPEREHWRRHVLRELRAAYLRGEIAIGHPRPPNAPSCMTIH